MHVFLPSSVLKTILAMLALACSIPTASGVTIHRSFRPTAYGTGGGTAVVGPGFSGGMRTRGSFAPENQPPRTGPVTPEMRKVIGKVTGIIDADSIWVTPNGGTRQKVHLARLTAPKKDEPYGTEAKTTLKNLVFGKQVEVRFAKKDTTGAALGIVFFKHEKGMVDLNLTLIRNGAARYHPDPDAPEAYAKAEAAAQSARLGLWAIKAND